MDLPAHTGGPATRRRIGPLGGIGADPWSIDDIEVTNVPIPPDRPTWSGPCPSCGDAGDSGSVTTGDPPILVGDLFDAVRSAACPDPDGSGSRDTAGRAAWLRTAG